MRKVLAVIGITVADVKYAVRNFIFSFLGVFIPGALGWLNDVSAWLNDSTRPIPDWAMR